MQIKPFTAINNQVSQNIFPATNTAGEQIVQQKINQTYTNSVTQGYINPNMPISYTKLGEIEIPGLKDKASVFQLANGQKVIIAPKKGPTIVKTTYNVGSMNETDDIRGISHFIEHNLFNGSQELAPREYDKKVSDMGGYTNASTSESNTGYFIQLQLLEDNSLEQAIKLNAQQTQFPTFPNDQLEKEKEPVKSEIDLYKDMPTDVANSIVLKNLFNINTKADNVIIGTKDNINSFTRDKVLDYYNTWYTPDNAVTVITGDVDVNQAIQLVSKHYNKKNDYSKINQRHYEPIEYLQQSVRKDIIQPNASTASVIMGFAAPEGTSISDQDKIAFLISLLNSSSSQLSKRLDELGLSAEIYLEKVQNKQNGAQAVMFHLDTPEKDVETVVKILYEELWNIANNPISQIEIDNIKKQTIDGLNSISETSSSLNGILAEMAINNNYNYFYEVINNTQNITSQDIQATARKFLDLNKVSMCVSHEKTATANSIGNNYNQNFKTVSFGSSQKPVHSINSTLSNVRQYKLPNNIETSVIQGNTSAKAALWLSLSTDELNQIPHPNILVLSELLNRGSLLKDKNTVQDILNAENTRLSFHATTNGIEIVSNFSSENLNNVLGLINETIINPNFTESEFERAKNVIKDMIINESPSASDKLNQELYPDLQKYVSKEEKIKQIDALTLNDIKQTYSTILSTSQAAASLTAGINENPYLTDCLNTGLSQLPVFKEFSLNHSQAYNIYKPVQETKILAKAEEQAQAEILQSYKFKKSENIDDIAKIEILNIILGGGMSSRLFTDLRENQKLAYHVSSFLGEEKDTKTITLAIGTTTDSPDPKEGSPDNATKALEGFKKNIELLMTENVPAKELENAKIQYKTEILNMLETNADLTTELQMLKNSPYGLNYYTYLFDAIDRITAEDIKSAANYIFKNPSVTSIMASQKTLDTLRIKE